MRIVGWSSDIRPNGIRRQTRKLVIKALDDRHLLHFKRKKKQKTKRRNAHRRLAPNERAPTSASSVNHVTVALTCERPGVCEVSISKSNANHPVSITWCSKSALQQTLVSFFFWWICRLLVTVGVCVLTAMPSHSRNNDLIQIWPFKKKNYQSSKTCKKFKELSQF